VGARGSWTSGSNSGAIPIELAELVTSSSNELVGLVASNLEKEKKALGSL
jgi:hypothetical protein